MKNYYHIIKKIALAVIIIMLLAVIGGVFSIYYTVWKTCDLAKEKYGGKCQTALVAALEDENASPKEKNDAIWALGQMADSESLAALEKIYVGKVPEGREPLNDVVSQYEIEKAIRWVKNGNATSWMYGSLKK
jgi:hypothetical protein